MRISSTHSLSHKIHRWHLILPTCLFLLSAQAPAQDFGWETLAGSSGGRGRNDGPGGEARFSNPSGAVSDSTGHLYVVDSGNSTIRRISPEGLVSTIAGQPGKPGTDDGPALQARFNYPRSIVRDTAGNLFIADGGNHTVRRLSPDGQVTTVAGKAGVSGSADGPASEARFNGLRGIAMAEDGTIYLSDSIDHTVRRLSPEGIVTTLAGSAGLAGTADGKGAVARFLSPRSLAVMSDGAVCVSDTANQTLRRITPGGEVTTLAGLAGVSGSSDGKVTEARFYQPDGLAVDGSGNLLVMDTRNALVRKVSREGLVSTVAGSAGQFGTTDGLGASARFSLAQGIAMAADGRIIVPDTGGQTVRIITPGGMVSTLAGAPPKSGSGDGPGRAAEFNLPSAIAMAPDGSLAVADEGNHTIRTLTPQGMVGRLAGKARIPGAINGSLSEATFNAPRGVAFDSRKTIYVADDGNKMVRRIFADGTVDIFAGAPGLHGGATRIVNAFGVAVDPQDQLYLADFIALRKGDGLESLTFLAGHARLFDHYPRDGTENFVAWDADFIGNGDGTGGNAYVVPLGLVCDGEGNIYFADGLNTIRRSTPSGAVVTIAGKAEQSGSTDGTGEGARFSAPTALALAADGTLYVADSGNHLIRRVSTKGVVTTIGGIPGYAGIGEGHGQRTQFANPTGLVVDATGALLVADRDNHRIVRGFQSRGPHLVVESSLVHLPLNAETPLPAMTPPGIPNQPTVLRLHNTGNYPLRLDSIRLEEEDEVGVFVLASNPAGGFLQPNSEISFQVDFTPRQLRRYGCTLVIRSNDAAQPVYRTRLSGTGNTLPVFSGYSFTIRYNEQAIIPVRDILARASDVDGQALTLTLSKDTSYFSFPVRLDEGSLFYSIPDLSTRIDHIDVMITDSLGGSVPGRVLVFMDPLPESNRSSVVLERLADGKVSLRYQGLMWQDYIIQRSDDLSGWSDVGTVPGYNTEAVEWIDTEPPAGQAFYRFIVR